VPGLLRGGERRPGDSAAISNTASSPRACARVADSVATTCVRITPFRVRTPCGREAPNGRKWPVASLRGFEGLEVRQGQLPTQSGRSALSKADVERRSSARQSDAAGCTPNRALLFPGYIFNPPILIHTHAAANR
jgi:hypothetical protein